MAMSIQPDRELEVLRDISCSTKVVSGGFVAMCKYFYPDRRQAVIQYNYKNKLYEDVVDLVGADGKMLCRAAWGLPTTEPAWRMPKEKYSQQNRKKVIGSMMASVITNVLAKYSMGMGTADMVATSGSGQGPAVSPPTHVSLPRFSPVQPALTVENMGDGGCTARALVAVGVYPSVYVAKQKLNAQIDPVYSDFLKRDPTFAKTDVGIPDRQWHEKVGSNGCDRSGVPLQSASHTEIRHRQFGNGATGWQICDQRYPKPYPC